MRPRWATSLIVVISVSILVGAVGGETWHRYGIGKINRVVAVPDDNTHFIAASEKGVLVRFESTNLSTVWRAPSVNTDDIFLSISVNQVSADEYFVVAVVKSPRFDKTAVRVYNATNGAFLWDSPGCKFAQVGSNVLGVRSCDAADNNNGNMVYLRFENGTPATEDEYNDTMSEKEWKKLKTEMGAGNQRGNGDLFWSPTADLNGVPVAPEFDVLSHPGGRMSLRKRGYSVELVSRNEGSAHTVGAVFLSSNNGYIRPHEDTITMDVDNDDFDGSDEMDVLVTISEFGSLFAYDLKSKSGDGEQLWLHDDSSMDVRKLAKNKCALVSGHVYHAVVLCVNRDAGKRAFSEVSVFEGSSGNVLFRDTVSRFRAVHSNIMPNCCSKNDVCAQLIDRAGKFRYVTTCKGAEYKKYNGDVDGQQTFISVGQASDKDDTQKIEGERAGKAVWRFQLPPNYVVRQVTRPRAVHQTARKLRIVPFRVTDDRKLLRKSSDPSKLLVMAANSDKKVLMAAILDGKSGNAHKIVNHANASAPFSSVTWDNWFVYSYWNTYLLQQELHVVDMYQSKSKTTFVADNFHKFARRNMPVGALKLLAYAIPELKKKNNDNDNNINNATATCAADGTCSAESPPRDEGKEAAPEFLHTAFLLSHQVVSISHSETDGGITENSLLFALANGQVVSLSRLLVDARRPAGDHFSSTESLMPYYPYLSFHPSDHHSVYLTGDKFIAGLQGIAVAPAKNRESSCHVAVFGTDLNYRRFTPAGSSFDTLPDDFRFKTVIGSIAALIFAAAYSTRAVEGKFLYESWFNE